MEANPPTRPTNHKADPSAKGLEHYDGWLGGPCPPQMFWAMGPLPFCQADP